MRIRLELGACSSQGKYQSVGGLRESQDAVLVRADTGRGKCVKARLKEEAGEGNRGNRTFSEEIGKED